MSNSILREKLIKERKEKLEEEDRKEKEKLKEEDRKEHDRYTRLTIFKEELSNIISEFAVNKFNKLIDCDCLITEDILISIIMYIKNDEIKRIHMEEEEEHNILHKLFYTFYMKYLCDWTSNSKYDNYLIGLKKINEIKNYHSLNDKMIIFLLEKYLDSISSDVNRIYIYHRHITKKEKDDTLDYDNLRKKIVENKENYKQKLMVDF